MQEKSRPVVRSWPFAIAVPLAFAIFLAARMHATGQGDPYVRLAELLIAVIAICAIWVVPASWSICAALALSMFGGSWQYLGLPNSTAPDRFALGIVLLAIAVRAPAAANRPRIRFRPLYILMYIAGAYAIGSAIAYGTIHQHAEIFDLLDRMMILHWLVFIAAGAAFVRESDRRVFLGTLVGMGIYLGLTGIFEIFGPHALVFPRYIMDPRVGIHFGRARGPFVDAAVNGLAMYACILASMLALRTWKSRLPRSLAVLSLAVCTVSVLLTFDRTTWLAIAISAPLTLAMVPGLRRYLIPSVVAVAAAVGLAYVSSSTVRNHIQLRAKDSQTIRDRESVDGAAEAMILQRPLFGFGWGRFMVVARDYYQTSDKYTLWQENPIPVHDVYLSIATDLGLVGLALWLVILLVGIGKAVLSRRAPPEMRPWRIALGALFAAWLAAAVTSPLADSFQSLIIWLWAAVVVSSERTGGVSLPRMTPIFQDARKRLTPSFQDFKRRA